MKKVYVIIGGMSGEDCSNDDPIIYDVYENLEEAKQAFEDIISDIADGFSDNCEYGFFDEEETIYEYTDFDYDEHGIIKLVEQKVR